MADERELSEEERREEDERRRKERPSLDQEIANKYDPDRLRKLVVKGAGRGDKLDLATRSDMERIHPGHDFSHVRVFRGAFAEEVTARHKADAVTVANTGMILVRESPRSAPGTTSGRALLAHEMTHVAQAQRGMHFALAHEVGHGPQEDQAHAKQHEIENGGAHEHQDPMAARMKEEARRARIVERAIELMAEEERRLDHRSGGSWTR